MGLLGKMFQRKVCAHCGCELGMTGWRSLSDGFLCKDCAHLLSPFFHERKESTTLEILGQLEYRKENQDFLASFVPEEVYGDDDHKVCVDRTNGVFLISHYRDWRTGNPDVVDLSAVRDVAFSVRESREEVRTRDANGNLVSYRPPCYRYSYSFEITVLVEHPYFDRMPLTLATGVRGNDISLYDFWARTGTSIQQALGVVPTQPMAPRMDDPLPPPMHIPHHPGPAPMPHGVQGGPGHSAPAPMPAPPMHHAPMTPPAPPVRPAAPQPPRPVAPQPPRPVAPQPPRPVAPQPPRPAAPQPPRPAAPQPPRPAAPQPPRPAAPQRPSGPVGPAGHGPAGGRGPMGGHGPNRP